MGTAGSIALLLGVPPGSLRSADPLAEPSRTLRGLIDPLKAKFAWLSPIEGRRETRQRWLNQTRAQVSLRCPRNAPLDPPKASFRGRRLCLKPGPV
jgi:hypothetical protein